MLEIKNISKSYGTFNACIDINLSLKKNQIVGLFGANGAGKSTCFHIMTGLIQPDNGTVTLNNENITFQPVYQRAGSGLSFLPQDKSIFTGMSVEENILCVLEIMTPNKTKQQQQLDRLIDRFNLNKVRKTAGNLLSGGERRRTEIARAVATDPEFILLDEPFSGVDPISIQEIKQLLADIQAHDQTGILISDHNVNATLPICDYAYIIHQGKKLAEGTPCELKKNQAAIQNYFGKSGD